MLALLGLVQLATGGIDGTVRSDAGLPIAGAVVTVDSLQRRVETDPAGRFSSGRSRPAAGRCRLLRTATR